jgi:hypothetical protein
MLRAVAAALLCLSAGCSEHYIPNTDVDDTPENRKIVEFCETYRRAVERKDIAQLLGLAAAEYYDDGGDIDASNDIDFPGLRQYLVTKFGQANGIRYEIRYRRVEVDDDRVLVDFTWSGSYRVRTAEGEAWRSSVEENRLELVPHGEGFKIIAGM